MEHFSKNLFIFMIGIDELGVIESVLRLFKALNETKMT